ncbi:hypothetical protein ACOMHN_059271 [Nucella lapillus]
MQIPVWPYKFQCDVTGSKGTMARHQPTIQINRHATAADALLNRTVLNGKWRTTKRSSVMIQMIRADTSLDSRDNTPATLHITLLFHVVS